VPDSAIPQSLAKSLRINQSHSQGGCLDRMSGDLTRLLQPTPGSSEVGAQSSSQTQHLASLMRRTEVVYSADWACGDGKGTAMPCRSRDLQNELLSVKARGNWNGIVRKHKNHSTITRCTIYQRSSPGPSSLSHSLARMSQSNHDNL